MLPSASWMERRGDQGVVHVGDSDARLPGRSWWHRVVDLERDSARATGRGIHSLDMSEPARADLPLRRTSQPVSCSNGLPNFGRAWSRTMRGRGILGRICRKGDVFVMGFRFRACSTQAAHASGNGGRLRACVAGRGPSSGKSRPRRLHGNALFLDVDDIPYGSDCLHRRGDACDRRGGRADGRQVAAESVTGVRILDERDPVRSGDEATSRATSLVPVRSTARHAVG